MTLQKYKICPSCGDHNPPNLLECKKCEADLTGIKVVDSSQEQKKLEEQPPVQGSEKSDEGTLVRICECGEKNPSQARKCKACGEDISDILPVKLVKASNKNYSYILTTVDGAFSVTLNKPICIIGREAELKEYLSHKPYVSRKHAELTIVTEKVFIKNLSKTNKTFINNEPIANDEPVAIKDGDEIGLGGKKIGDERQSNAAYFVFSVKV